MIPFMVWILFPIFGIQKDCHRTIIHKIDEHVRAKFSRLNFLAGDSFEDRKEFVIPRDRNFRFSRAEVRRPIPFPRARKKCELADDEQTALNVLDGLVHHAVFIVKHTKADNFSAHPFDVRGVVRIFNSHKHDKPLPNRAFYRSVD